MIEVIGYWRNRIGMNVCFRGEYEGLDGMDTGRIVDVRVISV